METILIARERATGKDVILVGRDASFPEQRAAYREFSGPTHEKYSSVVLVYLNPCKKPLKLLSQAEHEERAKKHAALVKASEAPANPAPEKKGKAKKKSAAAVNSPSPAGEVASASGASPISSDSRGEGKSSDEAKDSNQAEQ